MSKHISEEKFQELGIVQLPAQELVVRVGEMFLQVLGHPKALLALGAEDRLHGFIGSEPLPVLLVLVLGERCMNREWSHSFRKKEYMLPEDPSP